MAGEIEFQRLGQQGKIRSRQLLLQHLQLAFKQQCQIATDDQPALGRTLPAIKRQHVGMFKICLAGQFPQTGQGQLTLVVQGLLVGQKLIELRGVLIHQARFQQLQNAVFVQFDFFLANTQCQLGCQAAKRNILLMPARVTADKFGHHCAHL